MPFAVGIDANIIEIGPVQQIIDASKKRKTVKRFPPS